MTVENKNPEFRCDYAAKAEPFPHFWEHTVGSGHATLALRADWQEQLKRAHEELGFRYVRFHGILDDDMSTFLIEMDKPLYSFHNADLIIDFLLSIGMKPFVELSFMPTGLSSGDKIVFHYKGNVTPPKDQALWAELIRRLVQHWVDRYGIDEVKLWFFEVWNEPNLDAFGTGQLEDYFKLYRSTSQAIKQVDPNLQVGGPATAMNAWIPEFTKFCKAENLPLNFVSTHHYPTDAFGKPGDDTETQLSVSTRSVLREQAAKAKSEAGGLKVYYTEWCSSSNPRDPMHDEPYAAAFLVKTIMEAKGLLEAYSWWTFSDIFEENYFPSVPFHGGFGLLNIHNIAKPSYRAFELLHGLGTELLPLAGNHATVDAWLVKEGNATTALFTNFALPRHKIETVTARLTIDHARALTDATVLQVDGTHANAPARWKELGAPEYPTPKMVDELHAASQMKSEKLNVQKDPQSVTIEVVLAPQSVVAVRLDLNAVS